MKYGMKCTENLICNTIAYDDYIKRCEDMNNI